MTSEPTNKAEQAPVGRDVMDVEIRCPVHSRMLSLLRCFAKAAAEEAGFTGVDIDQIEMAVDEACANVVRHAYKHLGISPDLEKPDRHTPPPLNQAKESRCFITLRIGIRDNGLQFQIVDYGIGLHRMGQGVESVEEYVEREGRGGLGLYIIRNFMDEVDIQYPEGMGTVLTMTKYLKPAGSA